MIKQNNKTITAVQRGSRTIVTIYKGLSLVWEYIRSCFGKGYWIDTLPWINEDAWKNS